MMKVLSERSEFLQAGAVYELVEGLEGEDFSASGEEESLHVFAPHADPRPEIQAMTSNLLGPEAPSG
jgi:hypothetical protein